QPRMDVKVGVHSEKPGPFGLMQSAAPEVWIANQAVDPSKGLEPKQHLERVHGIEKIANGFGDRAALVEESELFLERIVEFHPLHFVWRGKLAQDLIEHRIVEQSVEDDVREGIGVRVTLLQFRGVVIEV